MGMLQKLQIMLSNHNETRENHSDEQLRSHYYKATKNKAFSITKELFTKLDGFKISTISEERGEIGISTTKGKKALIIVTIISVRPLETAIDFSVSTDTKLIPVDFGYSRGIIVKLYELLNKELPFIGAGINGSKK